jgi:hypothetical protein
MVSGNAPFALVTTPGESPHRSLDFRAPDDDRHVITFPVPFSRIRLHTILDGLISQYEPAAQLPPGSLLAHLQVRPHGGILETTGSESPRAAIYGCTTLCRKIVRATCCPGSHRCSKVNARAREWWSFECRWPRA